MSLQSASQRREQNRADARRAILEATETILVEEGYDAFSMRKLVDRCGYTAPTIYNHFGDKTGLIDALLEERFSRLLRRLQRVAKGGDPVAYLALLARAFLRFGTDYPSHYQLLTAGSSSDRPPPPSAERARNLMEAPILALAEEGRLRSTDCDALLQTLWALLHGIISLTTSRPDYEWSRELIDTAIDTFLNGLLQHTRPALKRAGVAEPETTRAQPRGTSR
jgi:AcrR family transcriptional regulator